MVVMVVVEVKVDGALRVSGGGLMVMEVVDMVEVKVWAW